MSYNDCESLEPAGAYSACVELRATVPGQCIVHLLAWHLSLSSTPCTGAELEGALQRVGNLQDAEQQQGGWSGPEQHYVVTV